MSAAVVGRESAWDRQSRQPGRSPLKLRSRRAPTKISPAARDASGPQLAYIGKVNGNELLRRLRRLAKARGVELVVDRRQGKGSHSTLLFAGRKTILKDLRKEIGPGLLRAMLNDIGLTPSDLDE